MHGKAALNAAFFEIFLKTKVRGKNLLSSPRPVNRMLFLWKLRFIRNLGSACLIRWINLLLAYGSLRLLRNNRSRNGTGKIIGIIDTFGAAAFTVFLNLQYDRCSHRSRGNTQRGNSNPLPCFIHQKSLLCIPRKPGDVSPAMNR